MTTFTALDPNGKAHTRNSKRTYTHAVFAIRADEPNGYVVVGWAGSLALAEKLLQFTSTVRYPRKVGRLIYTDANLANVVAH